MKKVKLFLLTGFLLALSVMNIQTAKSQGRDYKPYINLGANLSSGITSVGGEIGFYNTKAWYAVGLSTTSSSKSSYYLSPKGYWKITNSKEDNTVDGYLWSAVDVALDKTHALALEPGFAAVFNITKKFAPQVSMSFPVGENSVLRGRPLIMNFGISLNYWIR